VCGFRTYTHLRQSIPFCSFSANQVTWVSATSKSDSRSVFTSTGHPISSSRYSVVVSLTADSPTIQSTDYARSVRVFCVSCVLGITLDFRIFSSKGVNSHSAYLSHSSSRWVTCRFVEWRSALYY